MSNREQKLLDYKNRLLIEEKKDTINLPWSGSDLTIEIDDGGEVVNVFNRQRPIHQAD